MKEKFVGINFRPASLKMIATLDKILADYQAQKAREDRMKSDLLTFAGTYKENYDGE